MGYIPGMEETLEEQLTDLLMDNGCAVTKPGIHALCHWIALRDQSIVDQFIRQAEKNLAHLQDQTRVSDLVSTNGAGSTTVTNPPNPAGISKEGVDK